MKLHAILRMERQFQHTQLYWEHRSSSTGLTGIQFGPEAFQFTARDRPKFILLCDTVTMKFLLNAAVQLTFLPLAAASDIVSVAA